MNSSLFTAVKLRALDEATRRLRRPNRIDPRAEVSPLAQVIASDLHGAVTVDAHARLFKVFAFGPVSVGASTSVWGPRIYIEARPEPITIGNFCSIARDVSFHGFGHDTHRISTHYIGRNVLGRPIEDEVVSKGPIDVGHDVWIGAGAQIMSGVSIGTGAVIGAGSVVTHDVPAYAIAVGAPAKPVRSRFPDDLVVRLLDLRWWEWTPDEIRARAGLFAEPLTHDLLDRFL